MNICKEESKTGTSPFLIYNVRAIIVYRQKNYSLIVISIRILKYSEL